MIFFGLSSFLSRPLVVDNKINNRRKKNNNNNNELYFIFFELFSFLLTTNTQPEEPKRKKSHEKWKVICWVLWTMVFKKKNGNIIRMQSRLLYVCGKYWWTPKRKKEERKIGPFFFLVFFVWCWHLFFQWTNNWKMKRPFGALEVNVNSVWNTIPAPIGRSTWLCTITHNNNKIGHTDGVEWEAQEFLFFCVYHQHRQLLPPTTHHHHQVDPMHTHRCAHCTFKSCIVSAHFTSSSAHTIHAHIIYINFGACVRFFYSENIYFFILNCHWCVLFWFLYVLSHLLNALTTFKCTVSDSVR